MIRDLDSLSEIHPAKFIILGRSINGDWVGAYGISTENNARVSYMDSRPHGKKRRGIDLRFEEKTTKELNYSPVLVDQRGMTIASANHFRKMHALRGENVMEALSRAQEEYDYEKDLHNTPRITASVIDNSVAFSYIGKKGEGVERKLIPLGPLTDIPRGEGRFISTCQTDSSSGILIPVRIPGTHLDETMECIHQKMKPKKGDHSVMNLVTIYLSTNRGPSFSVFNKS